MALDQFSYRMVCVVHLSARLFDPKVEDAPENRPKTGPADRDGVQPDVTVSGTPGEIGYRRVWTVSPAAAALPLEPVDVEDDLGVTSRYSVALVGERGDENLIVGKIVPRKITLRMNAHRSADEAEVELPIEALPLPADGSLIRSLMVEVRRGVVSSDDWARIQTQGGDLTGVAFAGAADDDEPDFVGFADMHRLRFPESGGAHVSLTCRDFLGILADTQMQGRTLRPDVPIDEAVAHFLAAIPAMVGMKVVWLGPEDPPSPLNGGSKVKKSKKGKPLKGSQQKAEKQSCLDSLVDFCTLAGVVMTVRGYTIELRSPRTLTQLTEGGVRRMVLGQNLQSVEFEHKLTKAHLRRVAVVSFNPDTGRPLKAMWPTSTGPTEIATPGDQHKEAPDPAATLHTPPGVAAFDEHSAEVFIVEDVTDPKRLQDIARATWEEMARQDVSVRLTTRDIATIEGRALGVADLLALRAGDPLAIEIAPSTEQNAGSYVQRLARLTRAEAVAMLKPRGYSPLVAERVYDGIIAAGRPAIFYVREVEFTWGAGTATEFSISCINYVEVVDRELRPKGGAVAALKPDASYVQKWNAIENDMAAGEIEPDAAADMQGDLPTAEGEP